MTGFLCLDKPEGITSFSAVNRVRRICAQKKAGHTGTLDPMATGVLPVMLGGATKFAEYLPPAVKVYEADVLLGTVTDSYDITGTVVRTSAPDVSPAQFTQALAQFTGTFEQTPPMVSAISQNGVRLYQLARQGIEVERPKRTVTVHEAELLAHPAPDVYTVRVACSEGTYIRSLAFDLGEALGCGACLSRLRRTASNGFTQQEALTPEQIAGLKEQGTLAAAVRRVDDVLSCYPRVAVTQAQAKRFYNGGALALDRIKGFSGEGLFRVYAPQNIFLGLGRTDLKNEELQVARLLIKES